VSRSPLEEKTKQTNKTIAIPQMLRNEIAKENQNSSKIKTGKDETDRKQRTEMDPTGEAVKEKGEERCTFLITKRKLARRTNQCQQHRAPKREREKKKKRIEKCDAQKICNSENAFTDLQQQDCKDLIRTSSQTKLPSDAISSPRELPPRGRRRCVHLFTI